MTDTEKFAVKVAALISLQLSSLPYADLFTDIIGPHARLYPIALLRPPPGHHQISPNGGMGG
jgi:hypothetical protein